MKVLMKQFDYGFPNAKHGICFLRMRWRGSVVSPVLKERKESQEVDCMTLVLELYKDHQETLDSL